jgi:hypothetical protein
MKEVPKAERFPLEEGVAWYSMREVSLQLQFANAKSWRTIIITMIVR